MRTLGLILLCCFFSPAFPIAPEFKQLTPIDGLYNGTINDIAQDSYGQMWFATWDGLMRYDGYTVRNYSPVIGDSLGLPAKQVAKLFYDSKDNLWVVTMDGICRYDSSKDKFILYDIENQEKSFNSARMFESNNLLIIIFRESLYYLEIENINQNYTFKSLPITDLQGNTLALPLRSMNVINNELWISTRLLETTEGDFTKILIGNINREQRITCVIRDEVIIQGNVTAFASNKENQVFIGTMEGLYTFDVPSRVADPVEPANNMLIRELLISSDNKLWIGSVKSGLAYLDLHNGKFYQYAHDPNKVNSILSNIIFSLYEDFSGNLWIGHGGEGLNILNLRQKPFETFRHDPNNTYSLSTNTILCFNETSNEVLIGTNYDGLVLMKYNSKTDDYIFENLAMPEHFIKNTERHNLIWKIVKENDSIFWMGTNAGLIKANKKADTWHFEQYLAEGPVGTIRDIFIDKNKNMWLGCYNGLYLITSYNRSTMEYFNYAPSITEPSSLSDRTVNAILLDKSGNFWIGTQGGGLNLLSTKYEDLDLTGKHKPELNFIHFKAKFKSNSILNNNEINVLYEHHDGSIWIGTQGGGINILDQINNKFTYLTTADGLAGEDVFSLLPDGYGNLWISTNKGLSCYNLYEENFNNYSPSDGIQGNVFMLNSYFKSSTGKLYFGGRNGFTCFEPSLILNNKIQPKLSYTGLRIFKEDVEIGEEMNGRIILNEALSKQSSIILTHKEYIFSILFSVIHYQNPQENMAEYLLEGYDKNWNLIPASSGQITFNNLPHGSYLLKLRGRNSDNTWSDDTRELKINILPPWWKTLFARFIFLSLILSVVAGIMALILHRQSLKHLLKIEKIEIENLKELNEAKLRFFTNISHELRTPLSLTIAPIENLILKEDFSEPFVRKQLNLAHRNAKLLIRLINQIIDFRRLNAGKLTLEPQYADITRLLEEVVMNFEVFKTEKRINLSLNLPEKPLYLWYDPQKMEQIFYNLLSNAFKFTPAGGKIIISIIEPEASDNEEKKEERLKLMVYNDGKDIPEEKLEKIFERFYKIDHSSEGSGIGLSFTKSLVELHKGEIIAESSPGSGVRFSIFLPYRKTQHFMKEKARESEPDELQIHASFVEDGIHAVLNENVKEPDPELCVLIIEDNDELRTFLSSHFEQEYSVLQASNGEEGLKTAEETIPDIIICDIVMPVMDGLQVCEKIKLHTKTSHIPVILLTAKDTQEFKISGYDHGADAYVTKPFEIVVLDRQIKSLLRNRAIIHENYRKQNFVIDVSSGKISKDDLFISKLKEIIEENISDVNFNVKNLAKLFLLSETQVYRKTKALTGYSPVEFIRYIRLVKAANILRSSDISVKEVCYRTGFNNPSYFIKCFKEQFNVTPNVYVGINDPVKKT